MKRTSLLIAVSFAALALSHKALRLPGFGATTTFVAHADPTRAVQLLVWTLTLIAVLYLTVVCAISMLATILGMHITAQRVAGLLPQPLRVGLLAVIFTIATPLTAMASTSGEVPTPAGNDVVVMHRVTAETPPPDHSTMTVGDVIVMHRQTSAAPPPQAQPETKAEPAPVARPVTWTVKTGDSFWRIAQDSVDQRVGHLATEAEVAPYWLEVIAANESRLVDAKNPDLLMPGQVLVLPDFAGL